MVHVFKTPLVARTAQQKMRVRRMEQSLDRMRLEARVPTHDLDCIVQHVIRVNEAMQECIWAGGLARGSNKRLLHEKMWRSFKNPWLRGLMTNSWQPYENSYRMSVRHFLHDLAIHGVQRTRNPYERMSLRHGWEVLRVIEGEVIFEMPPDLSERVEESIPVRMKTVFYF